MLKTLGQLLQDKTREFVVTGVMLGGFVYGVKTIYDSSRNIERLTENQSLMENAHRKEMQQMKRVLVGIALEESVNRVGLTELVSSNPSKSDVPREADLYGYLDSQEEPYKEKVRQKQRELDVEKRTTKMLFKEFELAMSSYLEECKSYQGLAEKVAKVSVEHEALSQELHWMRETAETLEKQMETQEDAVGVIDEANRSLEGGILEVKNINQFLSACLEFLSIAPQEHVIDAGVLRMVPEEGMKIGYVPERFWPNSVLPPWERQRMELQTTGVFVTDEVINGIGDSTMFVNGNDLLDILEGKIELHRRIQKSLTSSVGKVKNETSRLAEENNGKRGEFVTLDEKCGTLQKEKVELERLIERRSDELTTMGGRYKTALDKQVELWRTYKGSLEGNFQLLGQYWKAVKSERAKLEKVATKESSE